MEMKHRSSITSRDEALNPGSWIPGTPVKPLLHQSHPISAEKQGTQGYRLRPHGSLPEFAQKQGGQGYWLRSHVSLPEFSHLTDASARTPDFTETGGGIVNYDESLCGDLRISKGPCQNSGTSITTGNNRISFMRQLALAEVGCGASSRRPFVAGVNLPASNACNEMQAGLPETSTSSFQFNGYRCANERCHPSKHSYDLNQPPIIYLDEFYYGTKDVAPETPYKSMREDIKHLLPIEDIHAAQNINNSRDKGGHKAECSRIQEIRMHNDSELQTIGDSTVRHMIANQSIDNEGNTGLNKMGNQKQKRKKHKPKVISEKTLTRTPKPRTPKQVRKTNIDLKTHSTGKRKYVRRSFNASPKIRAVKDSSETSDLLKYERKKKSCSRALTFDLDDQGGVVCIAPLGKISTSTVEMQLDKRHLSAVQELPQLGEDADIRMENISAQVQEYSSEKQEGSFEPVVCIGEQSHMQNERKDHNSECTKPAGLTAGKQVWEPVLTDKMCSNFGRPYRTYQRINKSMDRFPMHFSEIHEKRTHRVQPTCSKNALNSVVEAKRFIRRACHEHKQQLSGPKSWHQVASSNVDKKSNLTMLESRGALTLYGFPDHQPFLLQNQDRLKRKNSKGHTHTGKFGSVNQLSSCIQHPGFPFKQQASYNHAYMCIDFPGAKARSILKKKKCNRKQNCSDSFLDTNMKQSHKIKIKRGRHVFNKSDHIEVRSTNVLSIESITSKFERLSLNVRDISLQNETALVVYNMKNSEQNALVLYRNDGTIVPFEGLYTAKKQRPRPKVLLDPETNKVWKLLMENINSEGVDGTDEQKAKWWNDERHVFHGRADSFIARMRLVQGDRRFSQWKGSVVDSVIGVFLTQNVSDHLSSSAFMSLAACFPIKTEGSGQSCNSKITMMVEEPAPCVSGLEDINVSNLSDTLTCERCMTLHMINSNGVTEVASCIKSSESSYGSKPPEKTNQEYEKQSSSNHQDVQCSRPPASETSCPRSDDCSEANRQSSGLEFMNFNSSYSFMELLTMAEDTRINNLWNGNAIHSFNNKIGPMDQPPSCLKNDETKLDSVILHEPQEIAFTPLFSSSSSLTPESEMLTQGLKMSENVSFNASEQHSDSGSKESGLNAASTSQYASENSLLIHAERSLDKKNDSEIKIRGANEATQCLLESVTAPTHVLNNTLSEQCSPDGKNMVLESNGKQHNDASYNEILNTENLKTANGKRGLNQNEKQKSHNWDYLRKEAEANGRRKERMAHTMDSLDWEAVRLADVNEVADAIKERGMHNVLAGRIQDFLNRLVKEHGNIDLEWLRYVPPDKAKEYLLSIRGLGLKSVECVRLLTLNHLAFPVDTNVGRIAVRLGWVPLEPLPESLQLHLLELYPVLESIQKYLWPRLCKLDRETLYQLHYQMITFGKVFCTKSKPNCNACPMRGECRHFASAFASARLALPAPEEKSIICTTDNGAEKQSGLCGVNLSILPLPQAGRESESDCRFEHCEPIIEMPSTPEHVNGDGIVDIEDCLHTVPDQIPTIELNIREFTQNLQNYMQNNMELQVGEVSKALVALTPEAASIPMPKLKNVNRLRTEHQVYELPDTHPLLTGFDEREPGDPCSYLLAIWTPGETATSIQPPERMCNSNESGQLCNEDSCFSCNSIRQANSGTVQGTILIPCRTAMRGSFPLNGTYFQVNEVFADHGSSLHPIDIPTAWIWNLPRRTVFFGTSIPSIFRGLTTEGIQYCFWRGYVCVRGFDKDMRAPRPLVARLHFPVSKLTKEKKGNW